MAYAGAEFAKKILRAIKGETGITVPTYVNLASDPSGGEALKKELGKELEYFSSIVGLGVSPAASCIDDMIRLTYGFVSRTVFPRFCLWATCLNSRRS